MKKYVKIMMTLILKCLMKKETKYSQYLKSIRVPFLFYAGLDKDVEMIILQVNIQYLQYVHLMTKNNKYEKYRNEDCTKKFCKDLKKHVVVIIFY